MENIMVFNRKEKKYIMEKDVCQRFLERIAPYIRVGEYPLTRIGNLYFDTPDHYYIRNSIDAVNYKEKVRLRSYGICAPQSTVFLEIKKKWNGIVYKRREQMTLREAEFYIDTGLLPGPTQIMREIDYTLKQREDTVPSIYIGYERRSYRAADDPELRITFDDGLVARTDDLHLGSGYYGVPVLPEDMTIMELKIGENMPIWLAGALSEFEIYPTSFSKYGTAYRKGLENYHTDIKGGEKNVINF